MNFRLETILDIALEGEDVELFVDLIGNINQAISDSRSKPGFKNKNKFNVTLQEPCIEFVEKVAKTLNIEIIDERTIEDNK
jgi:hypothetical protein